MVTETTMTPRAASLVADLLDRRRRAEPEADAIRLVEGGSLSWAEWWERSGRVAGAIVERTAGSRRAVVLDFDNTTFLDFAVAYMGALRAACVAVLPPPASGSSGRRYVEDTYRPVVTIVGQRPDEGGRHQVTVSQLEEESAATSIELPRVDHASIAEVQYTSGTTADPRAVATRHETLCAAYSAEPIESQPGEEEVILTGLPFGTTFGHTVFLDSLQYPGSVLVVLPEFSGEAYLAACATQRASITFLVPAMAALLAAEPPSAAPLDHVSLVCVAGAAVSPAMLDEVQTRFPAATVVNSYCSTEAWPAGTDVVHRPGSRGGVGRPWEGREMRVVDDDGVPVAEDVEGNVELRCRGIAPRELAWRSNRGDDPFRPGGWVRTQDRGVIRNGDLWVLGRGTDMASMGGHVVDLAAVDQALADIPGVARAAAVALPHAVLGDLVVAVVDPASEVTDAVLLSGLRERLGPLASPREVHRMDEWPELARRPELAQLVADRARRRQTTALSPTERVVADLWGEILGVEVVDGDAGFFTLGGQSLDAVEAVGAIAERCAVALDVGDLITRPTVRGLAMRVDELIARDVAGVGAGSP